MTAIDGANRAGELDAGAIAEGYFALLGSVDLILHTRLISI
jgi:hypothetical protein